MQKLLISTHNKGKYIEIKKIFGDTLKTVSLKDLEITDSIDETGKTYEENAILKAKYYGKLTGLPTVADDSGIVIEALKNELGIHTRRWGAGPNANDREWITYFLERMKTETNKKARFICSTCFYDNGNIETFEGITEGIITDKLESKYLPGLPLSAVFKPNGYKKVFSALDTEEKNKISHRGKAFSKLYQYLLKTNKI